MNLLILKLYYFLVNFKIWNRLLNFLFNIEFFQLFLYLFYGKVILLKLLNINFHISIKIWMGQIFSFFLLKHQKHNFPLYLQYLKTMPKLYYLILNLNLFKLVILIKGN